MKLIILGSGGATTIPRPGCQCRVCVEARVRGTPYARSSASMYIPDIKLLFDTPEEISYQLNREGINDIDYIFYSHWHPDHTLGLRIVEKMYKFWLGMYVRGDRPKKQVQICALANVMKDLTEKYGSFLDFYKKLNLIETVELKNGFPLEIKNYRITPFKVEGGGAISKGSTKKTCIAISTVFLIECKKKKVIYAPCDVKPFPTDSQLKKPDLLILGDALPEGPLKDGIIVPKDNLLRCELFPMNEVLELAKNLGTKKTVLTHIEEEWGKNYDEYKDIEKEYHGKTSFAYDGMKITV